MSLYLISPIEKSSENKNAQHNLLEQFNLYKTLNEFNSKHLSSTYKSYVKNLPGDNYIKREKSKHSSSSSSSSSNNNQTTINPQDPNQPQQTTPPTQQQQSPISQQQDQSKQPQHGGLTKLVEGNFINDDFQQELILLSLDDNLLKSAFTLQDGGYQRPDKKRDKKHRSDRDKKKRKHRDGEGSSGGHSSSSGRDGSREDDKKKKSKKDRTSSSSIDNQHITVEHN